MLVKIFSLTFLAIFISFCGPNLLDRGPFSVFVMSPDSEGNYEEKEVTLTSLQDINTMDGDVAKIINASYESTELELLNESPVKTYYMLKDSVAKATNYETLVFFTAYHHFETIYNFWYDNGFFEGNELPKSTLVYKPNLIISKTEPSLTQKRKNNASFSLFTNSFFLYKTEKNEISPYALSLSTLAHEMGHRIMFYLWANTNLSFYFIEAKINAYNRSALDEGFADWCSYVVTGNPEGIYKDLGQSQIFRKLPYDYKLSQVENKGNFYYDGVLLTQSLYAVEQKDEDRIKITKVLFQALRNFRTVWIENNFVGLTNKFEFYYFINEIIKEAAKEDPSSTVHYCEAFYNRYNTPVNQLMIENQCRLLGVIPK